jgi:hypothetical protein
MNEFVFSKVSQEGVYKLLSFLRMADPSRIAFDWNKALRRQEVHLIIQ